MAIETFSMALAEVLRHEGGFADHPADPGGATMMGITRKTLESWRGRPVSIAELRALSRNEVGAIYHAQYWNAVGGDALPPGLDLALFDFAVNSGPARAIRTLNQVLGLPSVARISPATRQAIAREGAAALAAKLCAARLRFLERLPTYPTFGHGWRRRVAAIEKAARALGAQKAEQRALSTLPSSKEMTGMDMTKPIFTSKTIWANIIGFAALVLSIFGIETTGIDAQALAEHVLQAITAISFIISTVFRVIATRKLN